MESEAISMICTKFIEPLENKITQFAENLASKDDLHNLLSNIESKFKSEIDSLFENFQRELISRDTKILELEKEITTIKESRNSAIFYYTYLRAIRDT